MFITLNGSYSEFLTLSQRSERIMDQFDVQKNCSEPDWRELKRLTDDIAEIGDQMNAMISPSPLSLSPSH